MFTMDDVKTTYDSEGHPVYSLPNGNSITSPGKLVVGSTDGRFGSDALASGLAFINGNADSYVNAINQQALWKREDELRKEAKDWDTHALDRLVAAAQRNGINPIFLLDALNASGSSASFTTSASKTSNYDTNARTDQSNSAKIAGSLMAALAGILGAMFIAKAK